MNRTLPHEFPFMSRGAELDRILARLKGSDPAAFVLAGPAGVGKTRLASEAARSAAGLGYATAQLSAARDLLAAAAEQAAAINLRVAEATLLHDLARLGQPGRAAGRLTTLAELVDGCLVPAFSRHAAALESEDPAALAAGGGNSSPWARCSLPRRRTSPPPTATGRPGLPAGRAARRGGLTNSPPRAVTCGPSPCARSGAGPAAGQLTAREREVAAMAAAGASSRAIAERLVLSVRTVDNHLQSAYGKLGVTSRDELAELLGP